MKEKDEFVETHLKYARTLEANFAMQHELKKQRDLATGDFAMGVIIGFQIGVIITGIVLTIIQY